MPDRRADKEKPDRPDNEKKRDRDHMKPSVLRLRGVRRRRGEDGLVPLDDELVERSTLRGV